MTDTVAPQVFLGGSCNPTTWRKDIAIPAFEAAGVTYYNPQTDDWSEELVALEAAAKDAARGLLFVIDGQTRAMASMIEASALIAGGRSVVLAVQDIPDGTTIDGQAVEGRELKDLNRARAYLRAMAAEYGTPQYSTVEEAVESVVALTSAIPAS